MILETERLILCKLTEADYDSICKILQDGETLRGVQRGRAPLVANGTLFRPRRARNSYPRASDAKSFKSTPTGGELKASQCDAFKRGKHCKGGFPLRVPVFYLIQEAMAHKSPVTPLTEPQIRTDRTPREETTRKQYPSRIFRRCHGD